MAFCNGGHGLAALAFAVAMASILSDSSRAPAAAKDLDTTGVNNGRNAMAYSAPAGSPLDLAYRRVMRNPADVQANLEFARLAEASGYARWALATYERILLNHPDNVEAQANYMRLRRAFLPGITLVTVEWGITSESNPTYYIPPRNAEAQGFGSVAVRDERNFGDVRWRTTALAFGRLHGEADELNYAYAGVRSGPVFDLYPDWRIHPALGAAAAYFDNHFYYGEASASVTFENATPVVYRALELRGAYRSYDEFFPSSHGFYAEARGKIGFTNALGPQTAVAFSPWVLWSDIKGSGISPLISDLQPGAYVEWGGKGEAYWTATHWLVLGANLTLARRLYKSEIDPLSGGRRIDDLFIPGASVTFTKVIANKADVRLDYRHIRDSSTDASKSFTDDIVSMSVIHRFDPIVTDVPKLH